MINNNIKVISIGNLVMGGTGKTPHTIALAQEYISRGEKVAVISLGYKGGIGYDTCVISDGEKLLHTPPQASDEPYMIACNCPKAIVITGKRREDSIALAKERFGCTIAILDDGFQYKSLPRLGNILLLDYSNPISTGFPFPFGYLRERPKGASRADIVVFTRCPDLDAPIIPERVKKYVAGKPIFFSKTVMDKIVMRGEIFTAADYLIGKKVTAFSAVASNSTFKTSLKKLGGDLVNFKGFLDHALLSEKTIDSIIENGKNSGADFFITTEKDYVKLNPKHKKIFAYLKMEIEIKDKNSFFKTIDNLIFKDNM